MEKVSVAVAVAVAVFLSQFPAVLFFGFALSQFRGSDCLGA